MENALKLALKVDEVDNKTSLTKSNARPHVVAIVELNGEDANVLLKSGRIKMGWMNCRIRE